MEQLTRGGYRGGGVKDDKSPPLREKEKYITKNITSQVTLLANERV